MPAHNHEMPRPPVRGLDLDGNTRCLHYHGATDIIAIRMKCCDAYYACIDCHGVLAGHPARVWPTAEWSFKAVLCGVCGVEMTVREYLNSGNCCPQCRAPFNPGCRNHYHLYFEAAKPSR